MNPSQDYKQLLTQVIKKQIIILGPDITLAKARNVAGLTVADDGTVMQISGDSQLLTQKLVEQFVQLSGEIVKKTMEPLLSLSQAIPATPTAPVPSTPPTTMNPISQQPPTPQPVTPIASFGQVQDKTTVAQDIKPVQ